MKDYIVRFLIAGIMAVCVSLLILGGSQAKASQYSHENEWMWLTDGVITDVYGTRGGTHKGIDIAGQLGVPVMAVKEGVVTKSYLSESYGHVILVKHPDGYESVYAHLNNRLAKEGDKIAKGERIGTMGNTGYSTGVHLHFELHKAEWTFEKENAINPTVLLGKIEMGGQIAANQVIKPTPSLEAGAGIEKTRGNTHRVSEGETLWSIANTYGLTVEQLMDMNVLYETLIRPDQLLRISDLSHPAAKEMGISAIRG